MGERNLDIFYRREAIVYKQNILGLAYREYLREIKMTCKDDLDYHMKIADRSVCPRRPDFNRLWSAYCKERYGAKNGPEMFETLHEKVDHYKKCNLESRITMQRYVESENPEDKQPFILTILTPLMKRVHNMVNIK